MRYPQDILDRIKENIVLSDVISERVLLQRQGQYHRGLCPFHTEKTPSFTVTNDKGIYHCFGCGETGSVFDFLIKSKGLNFLEAVQEAAGRAGITLPQENKSSEEEQKEKERNIAYHALEKASSWYQIQLASKAGKEACSYLEERKIPKNLAERFSLGYAPASYQALLDYMKKEGFSEEVLEKVGLVVVKQKMAQSRTRESWDRFRSRLIFPIQDKKGRVIAFGGRTLKGEDPKYLNSPETPFFHKGKTLYGMWEIYKNKALLKDFPLVLVEGYLDVISLWREEIPGLAPLGTALTEEQLLEAWRIYPEPIICFDGDLAGRKAAFRALERALICLRPGVSLRFVHLPKGEDPASLIQMGHVQFLKDLLKKARTLSDFLWEYMSEQHRIDSPEYQVLFKKNLLNKISTIQNGEIREGYTRDILMRYQQKFDSSSRISLTAGKRRRNYEVPKILSPFEINLRHQKILFAMLIKHPLLLEDVIEPFSNMDLEEPNLIKLKDTMIEYYEKGLALEYLALGDYLKNKECLEFVEGLLQENFFLYAPFLKDTAPLSEVKRGWNEVWLRSQEQLALDRQKLELWNEFEETMSNDAWVRLQALNIEKEAQSAFIQDELEKGGVVNED